MAIRQSRPSKKSKKYYVPSHGPLSLGELATDPNKVLLEMAGVTEERRIAMIRQAVAVTEAGLHATQVKLAYDSDSGEFKASRAYADHEQRRRHAEMALLLGGVKIKDDPPTPQMQVNIVLPDLTSRTRGEERRPGQIVEIQKTPLPPF